MSAFLSILGGLIAVIAAVFFFLWELRNAASADLMARHRRHMAEARNAREGKDLARLRADGWKLVNGKTQCNTCGPHDCGQCGDSRAGRTLAEYKKEFLS